MTRQDLVKLTRAIQPVVASIRTIDGYKVAKAIAGNIADEFIADSKTQSRTKWVASCGFSDERMR